MPLSVIASSDSEACFVASLLAMTTEAMEVALVQKRLASLK